MCLRCRLLCVCAVVAVACNDVGVSAAHMRGLAAGPATQSSFHNDMLNAVNAERAKQGLGSLCFNNKLMVASQLHSQDQANTGVMSHTGSSGSTMQQRIEAQNFNWAAIAENVAAGQTDVAEVMNSWMNSPGHRANILGKEYTMFGFGVATNDNTKYKIYWTQDFGTGEGGKEACDGGAAPAAVTTQAPAARAQTNAPAAVTTNPPATARPDQYQATTTKPVVTPAVQANTTKPTGAKNETRSGGKNGTATGSVDADADAPTVHAPTDLKSAEDSSAIDESATIAQTPEATTVNPADQTVTEVNTKSDAVRVVPSLACLVLAVTYLFA